MNCCDGHDKVVMKDRVTVQTSSISRNSLGEPIPTYSTYTSRKCRVRGKRQTEVTKGDKIQSLVEYEITLVHDATTAAITSKMRFKITSQNDKIIELNGDGYLDDTRRYMMFTGFEND